MLLGKAKLEVITHQVDDPFEFSNLRLIILEGHNILADAVVFFSLQEYLLPVSHMNVVCLQLDLVIESFECLEVFNELRVLVKFTVKFELES